MGTMSPGCEDDGVCVCVRVCVCAKHRHTRTAFLALTERFIGPQRRSVEPHYKATNMVLRCQTTIYSMIAIRAPTPMATAVTKYKRVVVGWLEMNRRSLVSLFYN